MVGKIDDGGGQGIGRGTAIDNERNAVADLVADTGSVGTFAGVVKIGRGGGDGHAILLDDGARNGGVRDAQGDVAGVCRGAQWELAAGADDDGERAGPEAFGELVEAVVDVARQLIGLSDGGDEQRERLVLQSGLDLVNALDSVKIDGVDGESIEGVCGKRDDVATAQAGDDICDALCLWFIRVDPNYLC